MVWVAALLPFLGLAPPQGAGKIDFEAKAASLGQVIEKLFSQTGAKFQASPKIAQEIVFVRAHGVTLGELRARLAEAVAGVWVKEGDTEYLTREQPQEKAIFSAHVALRKRLVDEALKDTKKTLDNPFDAKGLASGLAALSTEDEVRDDPLRARRRYEAERGLFSQGPLARLLSRLVLACNPNDLAAVGPFERHIFSPNPTRMQRGFDRKKYEAAVAAYSAEQQAWIDEAAKVSFPDEREGRMVSDPRAQLRHLPTIEGLTLEVRRTEMTGLFFVNLRGGKMEPLAGDILAQSLFADPGRRFLDSQIAPVPPSSDDPMVALSEDSKEFQACMLEAFTSRKPNAVSQRMRQMMLGVEHDDPLGWTVSDALSAYADLNKLNMVAALSDETLGMALFGSRQQNLHVRQFMKSLVDSGTLGLQENGGWAVISPTDRYEASLAFTPRRSIVTLVNAVLSTGRVDIRDYARFAFESRLLNRGGLGSWFLAAIDRSMLGASDRTEWNTLRLYGSFNAQEQRDLEAGARFPYSGMNLEQRKIVERIVYGGAIENEVRSGGGSYGISGTAVEPTAAFPMGVPPGCTVVARVMSTPVLVAYGKGSDGKTRPTRGLSAWTLASIETDVVGNPEKMAAYGVAGLVGYAPGADKTVALRVELGPKLWKEAAISIPDYDPNATPVAWDKLPDPYPKQIADAIAQVKAQRANQQGRTIPPK